MRSNYENKAIIDYENKDVEEIGGGWYKLPNGRKVRGKDKALKQLKKLGG